MSLYLYASFRFFPSMAMFPHCLLLTGVAATVKNFQATPSMAMFPHILSKNCRFEVNFGQKEPWFPPPPGGYLFIDQAPVHTKVRGMEPPPDKSQCEVRVGVSVRCVRVELSAGRCITVVQVSA